MKKYFILASLFFTLFFLFTTVLCFAAGQEEAAEGSSSMTRGKYLAGEGIIIPPEEVYIYSYIAQIDYNYPGPEDDLGITLYTGNRQVWANGQEEMIHIGIQGNEMTFEDLPPMNLAFVIDKSGSMAAEDKMEWVKEAFYIFIERVRDIDFVSLIVFDSEAQVLFESTRMNSMDKRLKFKRVVESIIPGGMTNLVEGLELGYLQVQSNFRRDYVNRVLFLTDGVGESEGILEMAERFKEMGINVSTIGVGVDFDLDLMIEIAKHGGGSSRFISDMEEMEKTFGSELDRMVAPVARDLQMRLELSDEVEFIETWGYNNQTSGNTIFYSLPTLHHRDYETILCHISILPSNSLGSREIARFFIEYSDLDGNEYSLGPYIVTTEYVAMDKPVTGFSNSFVLQSGTMLHFAKTLITIGELYYSCQESIDRINSERERLWYESSNEDNVVYEELTNSEIRQLEQMVASNMQQAFDLTVDMKKELVNVRLRLDNMGFDDEIFILDNYIDILGDELELQEEAVSEISRDTEIEPEIEERSLNEHLQNLFREITLDLSEKEAGNIAVSGFSESRGKSLLLIDLLNEMALVEISKIDTLNLIERDKIDEVLKEQEFSLSDMADTETAIRIGKLLTADYIVTGTVIEMSASVVIFSRIINVESGEIESAAQVIVPIDRDMEELLKKL
jgi:TolB-like protein